jgi:hypothetical protein
MMRKETYLIAVLVLGLFHTPFSFPQHRVRRPACRGRSRHGRATFRPLLESGNGGGGYCGWCWAPRRRLYTLDEREWWWG